MSASTVGSDGRDLDRIHLLGVRATGHHGVLPEERRDGQTFVADVVLHLDTRPAAAADDLTLTADYGVLAERVAAVLAGPPVDLVETLAQRVADVALQLPGVEVVDVGIHKPQAPITVPFTDVLVEIRRRRADREPGAESPPEHRPERAAGPEVDALPEADSRPGPEPVLDAAAPEAAPAPDEGSAVEGSAVEGPAGEGSAVDDGDPLKVRPPVEVRAVLALGGNVGDARATLRGALTDLAATPEIRLVAVSPLARTVAVGPEQDDFYNAVAVVRTTLSPRELLAATSAIEDAHGRVRTERWGPRTLDVDIIVFDSLLSEDPSLTLPHPRARDRAFVLVPWSHVEPAAALPGPGGGSVAALARTAPDREGVRWLALDWFDIEGEPPGAGQQP